MALSSFTSIATFYLYFCNKDFKFKNEAYIFKPLLDKTVVYCLYADVDITFMNLTKPGRAINIKPPIVNKKLVIPHVKLDTRNKPLYISKSVSINS